LVRALFPSSGPRFGKFEHLSDTYFGTVTSYGAVLAQAMKPDCAECARLMGDIASVSMPTMRQKFPTYNDPGTYKEQQTRDVILIEAVHFRRGIHSMQVRDMEAEIRMPPPIIGADDKEDDSIAVMMLRELWWAGIDLTKAYQKDNKSPLTMALEMRLTGPATATMAAQRGNKRTASIEVLSIKGVSETSWNSFCLELWDKWNHIAKKAQDEYNSKKAANVPAVSLVVRPHWAKEWGFLEKAKDFPLKLRSMYAAEITEFRHHLEQYAQSSGKTADDYLLKFGNKKLQQIFAKQ
jgi:hypothetical protein